MTHKKDMSGQFKQAQKQILWYANLEKALFDYIYVMVDWENLSFGLGPF